MSLWPPRTCFMGTSNFYFPCLWSWELSGECGAEKVPRLRAAPLLRKRRKRPTWSDSDEEDRSIYKVEEPAVPIVKKSPDKISMKSDSNIATPSSPPKRNHSLERHDHVHELSAHRLTAKYIGILLSVLQREKSSRVNLVFGEGVHKPRRMRPRRHVAAYRIERAIASRMGCTEYLCACRQCRGGRVRRVETVARHHPEHGRDPFLPYPILAFDGSSVRRPSSPRTAAEENYLQRQNFRDAPQFVWPPRVEVNMNDLIHEAYARADDLHVQAEEQENLPPKEAAANIGVDEDMSEGDMEQLLRESTTAVYENCSVTRLQAGIILLNMCNLFGVPNTFLDELLNFLAADLLPTSNCLPRSSYEIRRMVMRMGLEHEAIHCCPDGHILYEGDENRDLVECPTCQVPRYITGSNQVPRKVLRYFPLVPRLQRLFRCPEVVKLMKWHAANHSEDGLMRSVIDSPQWAAVGDIDPTFVNEARNVYMGLVGDGVNPFENQSVRHSSWPILIVLYNLPPWLATRKFFLSLSMIIPGEKAPSPQAFDVYLRPLLNDLKRLWVGVEGWDASMPQGNQQFMMRGILLWTVNDFPAYGLISGQQVKGYRGCPVCTSGTCAEHSIVLKKMIYLGHRRFLPREHRFRRAKVAFNGEQEWDTAPERPAGEVIRRQAEERALYISAGGVEDGDEDPVKGHGIKRLSVLFKLPYWKKLPVRHLVDTMHTEKNLCENIMKTLLGEKDKPATRLDMQAKGIQEHLWLKPLANNLNKFFMPDAPHVLSNSDKSVFLKTLGSIKTPTGYNSNLANRISEGKIRGLKSHDYHVLMQQLLPVALRGLGDPRVTSTMIRLSRLYRKLCAKVVDPSQKEEMMNDAAEVLCCMEKDFPPAFFDIMVHLTIHLVEELFICGPCPTRWMYPYERYFKGLKGFVRNLAKPEGSIAQGYQVEEALGFITEYLASYQPTSRRVWDDKEDPSMTDEILEGKGKPRKLSDQLRGWIHSFVCDNASQLEEYRERYEAFCIERNAARDQFRQSHRRRRGRRVEAFPAELAEPLPFPTWLELQVHSDIVDGSLPAMSEDAEPGWRVILRKEVRGRRVVGTMGAEEGTGMFHAGRDVDHEALHPPTDILEENPEVARTGRRVRREDLTAQWLEKQAGVYDGDVGDSGPSSDDE